MSRIRWLQTHFTGSSLAWFVLLAAFASLSARILTTDWRRNLLERLESKAVQMDAYLSSRYSFQDKDGLNRFCKSTKAPGRRGERITLFSADGRIIADSRPGPAFPGKRRHSPIRPEVADALEKGVGREVRFSPGSRRIMAFVAYPHVHLGKVMGVIRLGAPLSWRDNPLLVFYLKIAAAGVLLSLCAAGLQSPLFQILQRLKSLRG